MLESFEILRYMLRHHSFSMFFAETMRSENRYLLDERGESCRILSSAFRFKRHKMKLTIQRRSIRYGEIRVKVPNARHRAISRARSISANIWMAGCTDEPMPFDVSARGEWSNTAPRRGMGANRWPTPRTRGRMRWERRLYGMKQQAGASCLSRTPSISLAPPRLLWSTFLAPLPPLFPGTLSPPTSSHPADHADTSQQPATSCYSKVISPDRCPSSFIPIDLPREQGTGERAGKNVSRSRTILAVPLRSSSGPSFGGGIDFVIVVEKVSARVEKDDSLQ